MLSRGKSMFSEFLLTAPGSRFLNSFLGRRTIRLPKPSEGSRGEQMGIKAQEGASSPACWRPPDVSADQDKWSGASARKAADAAPREENNCAAMECWRRRRKTGIHTALSVVLFCWLVSFIRGHIQTCAAVSCLKLRCVLKTFQAGVFHPRSTGSSSPILWQVFCVPEDPLSFWIYDPGPIPPKHASTHAFRSLLDTRFVFLSVEPQVCSLLPPRGQTSVLRPICSRGLPPWGLPPWGLPPPPPGG